MHKTLAKLDSEATYSEFIPTQIQIDTFAHRLLPIIQELFADKQIQKEYAAWKERQGEKA